MTEADRFTYDEKFSMGKQSYSLECRNFSEHDSVRIAVHYENRYLSFSSLDFPLDISHSDKRMILSSVRSESRWIILLNKGYSVRISQEFVEDMHKLRRLGASDSLACILTAIIRCENSSPCSAVDLYENFLEKSFAQYYPDTEKSDLLIIHADLSCKFSMEASENILKVLSNRFEALRLAHKELMLSNWPKGCACYVEKLSAEGLSVLQSFRLNVKGPLSWVAPIVRIICELSDAELSHVTEIASKLKDVSLASEIDCTEETGSNPTLFFKYTSQLNSERTLVSALMLEKYNQQTLKLADEIITEKIEAYECSISQLLTVCEFLNSGGNPDTPLQWMFEFASEVHV